MKALAKLSFPKLENEYLENILRQLVNQYNIIQIFFNKSSSYSCSHLIIHIDKNSDAIKLQLNKWVKKVKRNWNIDVYFIYSSRLHHLYFLASPFIEYYCRQTCIIYQNNESENLLVIKRDWKKYKKKFNVYQDRFYHDHDLHHSEIKKIISEGISNTVFSSYSRLIEYDMDYLEELYAGYKSDNLSLDERITNLIRYIPEIQKYFVKDSPSKFYLTQFIERAKEATANDDALYENEMYEALGVAEQNLFNLVGERFSELKKLIKKEYSKEQRTVKQIEEKTKNPILDSAIQTILKSIDAEEIFLYHQITYGEFSTYYLLLIANGISNHKLRSINQSLQIKMGDCYDFVLLGHSRSWIQNHLYWYQSFFTVVVKESNLIYSSSKFHAEIHWEVPHEDHYADLHFHYRTVKDTATQFLTIVNNEEQNYQVLEYLFTLFFQSFCRTYIYIKTYYVPNYVSNQTLWKMCLYADSDIYKYNYMLEIFWTDFFPFLEKHMMLQHKLSKLKAQEVTQMKEIVEKLNAELDTTIKEAKLLKEVKFD